MMLTGLVLSDSPASSSVPGCVSAPEGLVAWWPGDNNAVDVAGTNDGTLINGAGFTALGKVGPAFSFDGVDDSMQVPDSDLWAFSGDFTIDMWVNFASLTSTVPGDPSVLIGNDEGSGDLNKWFFGVGNDTGDLVLSFHINGPASGSHWLVNVPFAPLVGQWYHLGVTRSGTTYAIYVDGDRAFSEVSAVAIPNPNAPLTIGQAEGLQTHALIDEVEIFNRALNPGEMAAIHDAGDAGKCKPFTDTDDHVFQADIEWMASEGITKGCNPPLNDRFCPDSVVTRGQMAAFLVRALDLTERLDNPFTDDDDSIFEADIERLAAAGITKGCNPSEGNTKFCPDGKVTREQMAAFLVRALHYTDDGGGNLFTDDDDSIFEGDIDRLGTAGVTKGCNPPTNDRYCPSGNVTRGQMAAFLHRALS
jgi:hypothetical protein